MPPLLLICITAMVCSPVRENAKDMVRDWNDDVYKELTKAIVKELKLGNMETPKIVQRPEKGTFKFLNFSKAKHLFFLDNITLET